MKFIKKKIKKIYINYIKNIFVKIILQSLKYQKRDFTSFLYEKAHEKTFEILENELSKSLIFENKNKFRTHAIQSALSNTDRNGCYLEFGVAGGQSINYFAKILQSYEKTIHGFDTFKGNLEDWYGTENTSGAASQNGIPPVKLEKNIEIIKGKIEDTLEIFIKEKNIKKINFIHIDVNVYSTSKFILEITKPFMSKNSIICFDELVNYPMWWKGGEYKALTEVYNKEEYIFLAFDNAKKASIKLN